MIRFMSQLSVVDCYHPSVIFFVHMNMTQFYEQGRRSEERILNKIFLCSETDSVFPYASFYFHTQMHSLDQ
jgi:hypothetical protein